MLGRKKRRMLNIKLMQTLISCLFLSANLFAVPIDGNHFAHRFSIGSTHYDPYFQFDAASSMHTISWVSAHGDGPQMYFDAEVYSDFNVLDDVIFTGDILDGNGDPIGDYKLIFQWDERDYLDIDLNQRYECNLLKDAKDGNDIWYASDVDVFCITPNSKIICVEFDINSNVSVSFSDTSNDYTALEFENTILSDESGFGTVKRFYKSDCVPGRKYYLRVFGKNESGYYNDNHPYAFAVKTVRPVILVHGICSNPVSSSDPKTAFGKIKSELHKISGINPVKVYDFPWKSSSGVYSDYCSSLSLFINSSYEDTTLKPVVLAHSMGGILLLKTFESQYNTPDLVSKCIFLGTPFTGAKLNNLSLALFWGTSSQNRYHLSRGKKHIWDLLSYSGSDFWGLDPIFISGKVFNNGDIVVRNYSSNLPRIMSLDKTHIFVKLNHMKLTEFRFPLGEEHAKIFNIIRNLF